MSKTRKVCAVVTARPSYSRIKTALNAIRDCHKTELQLVVAGSALLERYGRAVQYIEKDGFVVSARAYMVLEGETPTAMAKTTGLGILELSSIFENFKPDIVVTVADRYETLATATAAAYMGIPIAHVQGGEVSGSIDERVRHAVTKLADFHFVATEKAKERVLKMGEDRDRIHITGCPSIDLAAEVLKNPKIDFDIFKRYKGVGNPIDVSGEYIVVIQHPVTTEYDTSCKNVIETLYATSELNIPVFWFWPNVDAGSDGTSHGIRLFRESERRKTKNFHFFKNMAPDDFLKLIYNSRCLVGNSSAGIRECSFLGVPAVNIGTRQEGRERGHNVLDVGYDRAQILRAVKKHGANGHCKTSKLYGDGHAGKKIADLLAKVHLSTEKKIAY